VRQPALVAAELAALVVLGGCTGNTAKGPAATGATLARQKGCVSCHTPDGRPAVGPTWKGLYGSKVVLDDGTTVTADDAYLRESIVDPSAKTVKGFQSGLMETTIKQNSFTDEQLDAIVAYIKTLR
jgi:cytochrome c1